MVYDKIVNSQVRLLSRLYPSDPSYALLCFRRGMYSIGDMTFCFNPSFTFRSWRGYSRFASGMQAALAK